MKKVKTILIFALAVFVSGLVFAQGGKITKLTVGSTRLADGELKIGEPLMTRDGQRLIPGVYRVSVALTSLGEAQFILSPFKVDQPDTPSQSVVQKAMNPTKETPTQLYVGAEVVKNLLVKGIASNVEGNFKIENITPSEALLEFEGKQFEATTMLGRSLDSKLIDLRPIFLSLDEPSECGSECIEGYIKVAIRNDGNSPAVGKWNVVLMDPRFYVGTATDVPAGGEVVVTSASRLKLPCCSPVSLDVKVHADFYNKDGSDSNDSNNVKRFSLKLKE